MDTLEDVLNGKEPEIEVVEEKSEETEVKETESTDVKAEDKSKDESKEKEASSALETDTKVPLSAMHGERNRRQAAERERDELRAKLEESTKTPPTSVFEDEAKFRDEVTAGFNQSLTNQALNQSEFFAAREIGRDVLDQKIEVFKTLAESNPEIRQRFANAVSPYHELVDIVDQHDELDKMKDLDGYKAKLRAEAKAEVKAELEAETKAKDDLRASIPDSLVGDTSQGGLTSKDWSGPPSIDEVINSS